jgi:hypothetical protein
MKSDIIKSELIEWLSKLDDKSILTSLLQFKKSAQAGDWTDTLSKTQLESLQRGLADLDENKVVSSEAFWGSYGRKV